MRRHGDEPAELRGRRPADVDTTRADADPSSAIVSRLQQSYGNQQTQRILAAARAVHPHPIPGRRLQRMIKSVDIHGETATKALFWLSQGRDPRSAPQIDVVDGEVADAARDYAHRTITEAHAAARGALQRMCNALHYVQTRLDAGEFNDPLMARILQRLGNALDVDSLSRQDFDRICTPIARAYDYLATTGIAFDAWNEHPSEEALTVAWSQPNVDQIHLMTQFYLAKTTPTERGLTIIHEIMHILDPAVAHNLDNHGWFRNAYRWENLVRQADALGRELIEEQRRGVLVQ